MQLGDELEAWEVGIIIDEENDYHQHRVLIVDQEFPSLSSHPFKKKFKPKSKPLQVVANPMYNPHARFYNSKKAPGQSFKELAKGSEPAVKNSEISKNPNFGDAAKPLAAPISDADLAASYASPEKKNQENKIKFESGGPKKFTNSKKEAQKSHDNSPQKPDE